MSSQGQPISPGGVREEGTSYGVLPRKSYTILRLRFKILQTPSTVSNYPDQDHINVEGRQKTLYIHEIRIRKSRSTLSWLGETRVPLIPPRNTGRCCGFSG